MIKKNNWKILKKLQAELDKKLMKASGFDLNWWNSLKNKKRLKLALLVEIGELANEIKSFTIWKKSKTTDWEKVKEELIDCLGYFLGLVNFHQIETEIFSKTNKLKKELFSKSRINQLLLNFFQITQNLFIGNSLIKSSKINFYKNWLKVFSELSYKLNINEQELMRIYYKKNSINYERLERGRY